jgi:DNA-binding GntR family transcriptional regulator
MGANMGVPSRATVLDRSFGVPRAAELIAEELPAQIIRPALEVEKDHEGNWMGELAAGFAFHRLLVDLAGNRTLAVMHGLIEAVILASGREIGRAFQPEADEEARRFRRVHVDVVHLIEQHEVAEAEGLWRRHLRAKIRYLESMEAAAGRDVGRVDMLPRGGFSPAAPMR